VMVISAVCAGIGGMLGVAHFGSAQQNEFDTYLLDSIAAVVVGGTGLYFKALTQGLAQMPDIPDAVRRRWAYRLGEEGPEGRVHAIPGEGTGVPIWMLGSSLYGAQLAAALGLPYAFASHFAPAALDEAIALYRERFRPSPRLDRPHVMAAMNVFAADTEAEVRLMMSSLQQAFVRLGRGETGPLPAPVENYEAGLDPLARARLDAALSCSAAGTGAQVRAAVDAFARRTGADEIMVTSQVFDHAARRRSFEILAEACADRLEAA
jgi:luciferase family oxidoreductase group 1